MVLLLACLGSSARADDSESAITSHEGQFGGSVRLGMGVRGIATYENTIYCGKLDAMAEHGYASVCTGRMPISLDLEAAYGVARSIELTFELRIGLESDFESPPGSDAPRPFHIAPGARFFFSEAKRTKLFVQPELVLDFAGYERGNDLGFRGIEGFWIDLHPSYGFYIWIAETLEFKRWISASFEGGIGFQGRYP